jgi:hypothetical protein
LTLIQSIDGPDLVRRPQPRDAMPSKAQSCVRAYQARARAALANCG